MQVTNSDVGYFPVFGVAPGQSVTITLTSAAFIGIVKLLSGPSPDGMSEVPNTLTANASEGTLSVSYSFTNEGKGTVFFRAHGADYDGGTAWSGDVVYTVTEGEDTQESFKRKDGSPYLNVNDSGVAFPEPVAFPASQGVASRTEFDSNAIVVIAAQSTPVPIPGTGGLVHKGQGFTLADVALAGISWTADFKGARLCRVSYAFKLDPALGAVGVTVNVTKNGVAVTTLAGTATITAGTPGFIANEGYVEISEGDVIQVTATNNTNAEDITVSAYVSGINADYTASAKPHGFVVIEGVG